VQLADARAVLDELLNGMLSRDKAADGSIYRRDQVCPALSSPSEPVRNH